MGLCVSSVCVLQSVCLQSPVGQLQMSGCEKGIHTITINMDTAHGYDTLLLLNNLIYQKRSLG